jgi:hypothetical protein
MGNILKESAMENQISYQFVEDGLFQAKALLLVKCDLHMFFLFLVRDLNVGQEQTWCAHEKRI